MNTKETKKKLVSADDVVGLMTKECKKLGSQSAFADQCGVTRAFVSAVMKGNQAPTGSILKRFGLEKVVMYSRTAKDESAVVLAK
jgi:predicted transcriptional regulator